MTIMQSEQQYIDLFEQCREMLCRHSCAPMNAVREAGHELVICATEPRADVLCSDVSGVRYYIAPSSSIGEMEAHFQAILKHETPDVVHIFGTEFEQCMAMANCADVERTVVQIQGAMTLLKDVVYAGLPARLCRDNPLHKLLRRLHKGGQSIDLQRQSFERRAAVERQVLKSAKYVFGASAWGNAVAKSVNPDCITFDCNLILRDTFYSDERWSQETCEKHSIYILFSYPIKGFHKFLEALPQILRQYPDTMVYVVANQLPIRHYTGIKRLIQDAAPDYNWLIQKQIEKNNLQGHLKFIGHLNEEQVKERMLKSNVFVSASALENQSTSLGEAMILGVPSVASAVGAIPEMIDGTLVSLGRCSTPLIMVFLGMILAESGFSSMISVTNLKYAFLRLVFIPVCVLVACLLLHIDPLVTGLSVLLS